MDDFFRFEINEVVHYNKHDFVVTSRHYNEVVNSVVKRYTIKDIQHFNQFSVLEKDLEKKPIHDYVSPWDVILKEGSKRPIMVCEETFYEGFKATIVTEWDKHNNIFITYCESAIAIGLPLPVNWKFLYNAEVK